MGTGNEYSLRKVSLAKTSGAHFGYRRSLLLIARIAFGIGRCGLAADPLRPGAVLGVSFICGATVSLSLWCLTGLMLARMLKTDGPWRRLDIALGLLLAVSTVPMWPEGPRSRIPISTFEAGTDFDLTGEQRPKSYRDEK